MGLGSGTQDRVGATPCPFLPALPCPAQHKGSSIPTGRKHQAALGSGPLALGTTPLRPWAQGHPPCGQVVPPGLTSHPSWQGPGLSAYNRDRHPTVALSKVAEPGGQRQGVNARRVGMGPGHWLSGTTSSLSLSFHCRKAGRAQLPVGLQGVQSGGRLQVTNEPPTAGPCA